MSRQLRSGIRKEPESLLRGKHTQGHHLGLRVIAEEADDEVGYHFGLFGENGVAAMRNFDIPGLGAQCHRRLASGRHRSHRVVEWLDD